MLAPAPLRCPISLDCPPICPQITPCGHVFSFHAILQHLVSASGAAGTTPRAAVKCPLCYTPFGCRELRLVRVLLVQPLQVEYLALLMSCQMCCAAVANHSVSEGTGLDPLINRKTLPSKVGHCT